MKEFFSWNEISSSQLFLISEILLQMKYLSPLIFRTCGKRRLIHDLPTSRGWHFSGECRRGLSSMSDSLISSLRGKIDRRSVMS